LLKLEKSERKKVLKEEHRKMVGKPIVNQEEAAIYTEFQNKLSHEIDFPYQTAQKILE
jgi:hypothetical protein